MGEDYVLLMGLSLIWKNQKYPFTNPEEFGVFYFLGTTKMIRRINKQRSINKVHE
jgi:hypothetical protein